MSTLNRVIRKSLWKEDQRLFFLLKLNMFISHFVIAYLWVEYLDEKQSPTFLVKEFLEENALWIILEMMVAVNIILSIFFIVQRRRVLYEVLCLCGMSKKTRIRKQLAEFFIPYMVTWIVSFLVNFVLGR